MRMNTSEGILLKDWIDTASQTEISDTLKNYGEEKFHHRISIAVKENSSNLKSTLDLANCIEKCLPKSYVRQQKIHVATRSFQAFRIMLNRELESLKDALNNLFVFAPRGRIMVISFHSLEDRIVKNIFREWERSDHPIPGIPGDYKSSLGRCSPRKVIRPTELEVEENSASRSARMRILKRLLMRSLDRKIQLFFWVGSAVFISVALKLFLIQVIDHDHWIQRAKTAYS